MKIAILVPVCSRNQNYKFIEDTPLMRCLLPSFERTKEDGYTYTFFVGYDEDDDFYRNHATELPGKVSILRGCQHAPARAWNVLASAAYADPAGYDYFFQIGDDVILETPKWTSQFVKYLQSHDNVGVVGPCNLVNHRQRVAANKPFVIENGFVHRKHLDTFGYFFHPGIRNWYCDDWLTRVYDPPYSAKLDTTILCRNTVVDTRYAIEGCPDVSVKIADSRTTLQSHGY